MPRMQFPETLDADCVWLSSFTHSLAVQNANPMHVVPTLTQLLRTKMYSHTESLVAFGVAAAMHSIRTHTYHRQASVLPQT